MLKKPNLETATMRELTPAELHNVGGAIGAAIFIGLGTMILQHCDRVSDTVPALGVTVCR